MKLVVEVLDASNLIAKDGQGSSSPFVEVEFDQQLHRTQTKAKDLDPVWNETLSFNVSNPTDLPNRTIDIVVYHERIAGHHRNFLGRVRISGVSVPLSESDAAAQRYPLDKRSLFSHIRGEIALKIYAIDDPSSDPPPSNASAPPEESGTNDQSKSSNKSKKKKKKKNNPVAETQPWYSNRSETPFGFEFDPLKPEGEEEKRSGFFRMEQGPISMVQLQHHYAMPTPPEPGKLAPADGSMQTRPNQFGLVDHMEFLYVKIERGRDLPAMDLNGSLDPYVEVKVGNYKGVTKYMEKNQNPVWSQVFGFTKERVQANRLEVVVKDRDLVKDDWVGRVVIEIDGVPRRVPPDGPLAPEWHRLENKDGNKLEKGEIMLAVWMGTQADHYFPETLHSDVHTILPEAVTHTRSGIYHSPKLYYLRVHVIEAQDLVISDNRSRIPDSWVRIELSPNQVKYTRPVPARSYNPMWNEELLFVATEPLSEQLLTITVEDRIGPTKRVPLGQTSLLLSETATFRPESDPVQSVDPRWFNLGKPDKDPSPADDPKFASKIHLRICLDGGYHVLDESTHYGSDVQPSARHLWRPSIGVLEVGILGATNLRPIRAKDGRTTTSAYVVAKYGCKWVRTRTHIDSQAPRWHEQYTWEVYDPCTVITLAVFNNCQIRGDGDDGGQDRSLGRVRIRLSTLETGRVYNQSYPLLMLGPTGLKPSGELHVAFRFTCISWLNMLTLYSQPLLPTMHYLKPIPVVHVNILRRHAVQIVAARLALAEPPLRPEVVGYVLDVDHHMWSLRQSWAHFDRIRSLLSGSMRLVQFWDDIKSWRNPITTCLANVLFFVLVCYPELILPTIFLYLCLIGLWNYRFRPQGPARPDPKMSHAAWAHSDELDEEFDTLPTRRPDDVVRMRYDRLRSVAGRAQAVVGDLATQVERAHGLLGWRDSRATGIFVCFALMLAFLMYVVPFQVPVLVGGLYLMRHPRFRAGKMPSVLVSFFKRLPTKSDLLL